MKKKLLALLLCSGFVLTAGCSGGAAADESESAQGGKIVMMGPAHTLPEQKDAWDEVCAAFTAETGIEVEQRRQGTWSELPQMLQAAKLAKEQVDIVVGGVGTIRATLGPSGSVMDLTELMKGLEDRFPEGILDSCYIGDHLWAIPYADASGTSFFYNKTMFNELGIEPPTTMAEFKEISQKITDEKGIMPMAFQGKDSWAWPMPFFDTYAQTTGGKSIENVEAFLKGERAFTGEEEKQAMELLKEMYDSGIMTGEVFDTDGTGMVAAFAQQKAAMIFCGTWDYPVLKSMDVDFEVGGFEFPQVVDGAKPIHSFAVGDNALFIPSFMDQANLENTMRFVEFILREENAKKTFTAGDMDPIFEVVKGAVGEQDDVVKFLNEKIVPNSVMYLDWVWPAEINDTMSQVIPAVVSGRMTSQEAAEAVQKSLEAVKNEKEYTYDWWNKWTEEDWAKVTPTAIPDVSKFAQ